MANKPITEFPPLDGSILPYPGFADFQARVHPDHPWAIWPVPGSQSETRSLSFREFAKATHRLAHVLRPGRQGPEGENIAIVINTDSILYCTLLVACIRAGFVPFPMSPRNTGPAVCNMLEKSGTHRIIIDSSLHSLLSDIQTELDSKNFPLGVTDLPGLFVAFPSLDPNYRGDSEAIEEYPPPPTPIDTESRAIILHSSGSTGFPKPITFNQEIVLNFCRSPLLIHSRKYQVQWGSMALPTFHGYAFVYQFLTPFAIGVPVAHFAPMYPSPPVVPNPEVTLEACRITKCTGIPAVPSFLELWAREPEAVAYLRTLKTVVFAGGPLSKKVGDDLVAAGVAVSALYAGTEFHVPSDPWYSDVPTPEDDRTPVDWEWLKFSERYNLRWVPQGDGSYELHFLRCATHQPAVENLPDVRGYATSDLFVPHPTKKGLWRICGRADDVIVLATGEKIVPLHQEGYILTDPLIVGATVFGRGRDQAGVLVEPIPAHRIDPTDERALTEFRNKIWPTIEAANHLAPAFARIFKEMILVGHPSKPFPRAPKGTVSRKQLLNLYEKEINDLYEAVKGGIDASDVRPPDSWDVKGIEAWLLQEAASVSESQSLLPDTDLFQQGFDSLSATFLRNRILFALRKGKKAEAATNIPQNFIFDHPSIQKSARAIAGLVDPSVMTTNASDTKRLVHDLITKYTADMPTNHATRRLTECAVLLTGSTGNLGSHILAALLADARVAKVYTLDRSNGPEDIRKRLASAFANRRLPAQLLADKKLFSLTGDLGADNFGLDRDTFGQIKSSVTHVIHNAWLVHFNLAFPSFETLVSGTRKLIDVLLSLEHSAQMLFTSSVAVAQGWDTSKTYVPETLLSSGEVSPHTGYAISKYVTEHILSQARSHGLNTTCLRMGQMCGSQVTGAWNVNDWVPIMIKSSITLGALPAANGVLTWLAADDAARMTLDLIFSDREAPQVLNAVHPRPVTWHEVLQAVNIALGGGLQWVPISDWLSQIERKVDTATAATMNDLPALKLIEFFRSVCEGSRLVAEGHLAVEATGLPLFSTTELERHSQTMHDLRPLGQQHADKWIQYWKEQRFL